MEVSRVDRIKKLMTRVAKYSDVVVAVKQKVFLDVGVLIIREQFQEKEVNEIRITMDNLIKDYNMEF